MFPSAKTRFTSAFRRSFDLALEFATLGEYRLSEAPLAPPMPSRPARSTSGSEIEVRVRPRATRLRPATAAARRLSPEVHPRRISARTGVRALAFDAHGAHPTRRVRHRAGSARPAPQPCLVADPAGSGAKRG
jgi:hypothetical protein